MINIIKNYSNNLAYIGSINITKKVLLIKIQEINLLLEFDSYYTRDDLLIIELPFNIKINTFRPIYINNKKLTYNICLEELKSNEYHYNRNNNSLICKIKLE